MGGPITVTGTMASAANSAQVQGTVDVMLCGYGSRVPRVNGFALVARLTEQSIQADTDGNFEIQLAGNDEIVPDGTYYTITIRDENGDIAQVNAYRFLSTTPTYDLNLIDPYDPNQPPPPLPPLITDMLVILPAAPGMEFDCSASLSYQTTLTEDVTAPVFSNAASGQLYTFIILQDGTGGWKFIWPANVRNAASVDPAPNSTTIQTFIGDDFGNLSAISAGTYYP